MGFFSRAMGIPDPPSGGGNGDRGKEHGKPSKDDLRKHHERKEQEQKDNPDEGNGKGNQGGTGFFKSV